jgi:hypothetical protein
MFYFIKEIKAMKIKRNKARHLWLTPAILATWEVRSGGSWLEASPGKNIMINQFQPIAGCSGMHLSCQLLRRLRSAGMHFQANLGKKVHKTASQQQKAGCGGTCLSAQLQLEA